MLSPEKLEDIREHANYYKGTFGHDNGIDPTDVWKLLTMYDAQKARIDMLEQEVWLADAVQEPLLNKLALFERDAKRYQWLRDLPEGSQYEEIGNYPSDMWDSAIDDAMTKQYK